MERDYCLGIDTSCYTTSVACVSEQGIVFSERTMLSVPFGERGLRQSDGLFQHTKQLAPLIEHMFQHIDRNRVGAICVSSRPVDQENSYMPVFLAGYMTARSISASMGIPLIETAHQNGHFRAALVGNEILLGKEFYGLHISGGTTDLLRINSSRIEPYQISMIGTSSDLHAGQFVDRIGVSLGLSFPAGKHLEELAAKAVKKDLKIPSSVLEANCSFSGAESAAERMIRRGEDQAEVAYAVYDCLARTVAKQLKYTEEVYGNLPFLICGGVASSSLLRSLLYTRTRQKLYFGKENLSSDNAVGVAMIGLDRREQWNS